jgi:hypothetical protein
MTRLLAITFLLLSSLLSSGQKGCKLSSLPKKSEAFSELMHFWADMKQFIAQKDTTRLISLFDFPFFVGKGFFPNAPTDGVEHYALSANNIMNYAGLIFFNKQLEPALSLCNDPTECLISHGSYRQKHKTCAYVFCYNYKNNEERCFSIVRIGSSYKLTSAWIRR